jgi:hypothetical protein
MNLLQIREQFRNISGRYDLVNDNLTDNGANLFINEGSTWLDSKSDKRMLYKNGGAISSAVLTLDTDTNFWSTNHPMLLIQAAIYKTFATSGNRTMKKDYQEDIAEQLADVDMDFVEKESCKINQMRDSNAD